VVRTLSENMTSCSFYINVLNGGQKDARLNNL